MQHSPQHAGNIFASGQQEAADVLVGLPVNGRRDEKVFDCAALVADACAAAGCTYGCRLAGGQRRCRAAGSAARPGLRERSRVRPSVPEAAASGHGGGWDTCCAATRSSVQCLGLGRPT
jgi:hypothetical protein